MSRPPTKPGTRRLSELARHVVVPSGIVSTGWPAVRDRCADLGIGFDDWQDGTGRLILAKREDGQYAAGIGGVVISIPRQVGKTFLVGAIVFALCLLYPGLTVIWTAHRARTAGETFDAMQGFARRPRISPHILHVLTGAGSEEIGFHNGSRILFGARERGFGRGFTVVDIVVMDEAQILTENAIDDMVPATNQAPNPLLLFTGTPPKPTDPSEVFSNRRTEALSGDSDDMVYVEFSADEGADPQDREQWSKANPSFPERTPASAILRLIRNLSPDSFLREGLGIWDDGARIPPVFDMDRWAALAVAGDEVPGRGRVAYGIKFSPDGDSVALAVALRAGDLVHIEGVDHRSMVDGTRWLVDWLLDRWPTAAAVVVDGKSGAGAFVKALGRAGMRGRKLTVATGEQVITATSSAVTAVSEGTVTHIGDPVLTAAVRSSGKRPIGQGGGYGLQSRDGSDVTLAEAAVLAHFGAGLARGGGDRSGARTSSRRAVVLS